MHDTHLEHNIEYYIALSCFYSKEYSVADSLFQEIIISPKTASSRLRQSFLNLSKMYLYIYDDYDKAMYYINRYLSITESSNISGAGFSIKGDIFYETGQYDSAYIYHLKSLDCLEEIHTVYENYNKLAKLSVKFGNTDDALSYMEKYENLYDSITNLQKVSVVDEYLISNTYNSLKQQLTRKHRFHFLLFAVCLLSLGLTGFLLFRHRVTGAINQGRREIEFLKTRLDEQRNSYEEKLSDSYRYSHDRIYSLYRQKIQSGTEVFRTMDSFRILMERDQDKDSVILSHEEKTLIHRNLSESFKEIISEISLNYPSTNPKDIYVLLLSGMGFSNRIIAELSSVSESAIRKKKERLLEKLEPDLYNLLGSRV